MVVIREKHFNCMRTVGPNVLLWTIQLEREKEKNQVSVGLYVNSVKIRQDSMKPVISAAANKEWLWCEGCARTRPGARGVRLYD